MSKRHRVGGNDAADGIEDVGPLTEARDIMVRSVGPTGGVGLPITESKREPIVASGRIEWRGPTAGFGTQPPAGNYFVLDKAQLVNGRSYDALYIGRTRQVLPVGHVTLKGQVYEYAERVVEGVQRYAVLENFVEVKPKQQRPQG